jgi:hypothetical protein
MKPIFCIAVGILVVAPLVAQTIEMPAPSAGPTATLGELLLASQEGMRAQRATAVADSEFNFQILVPVAVNSPGLNGTFYRSDYFLANGRPLTQDILVGWIAAGVDNASAATQRFTLNPSTVYSIQDVLGNPSVGLNKTGLGSILITAVLPGSSTPDLSGQIAGSIRIWTPQPGGAAGTNSFTANAINPNSIHGDVNAVVFGVRQNAAFRTNYGLINLDPVNSRSWTVTAVAANTTSWTVMLPRVSMQQVALPGTITPTGDGYFFLQYTPLFTTDSQWNAFANSADNVTGDAWFNLAFRF